MYKISQTLKMAFAMSVSAVAFGSAAQAQEYSLITDSSVVGQNFDLATSSLEGTNSGEVDIIAEGAVIFKNLELINLGTLDGQTFFGVDIPLRARYMAGENTAVELGVVATHNFGDDDSISDAEPIFRLIHRPAEDFYLITGTLIDTHPMHEALLDDTAKFADIAEQGFQFRSDRGFWKQDAWINWRKEEGDFDAEEFEVGSATRLSFYDDIVLLDLQMLVSHAGGQISRSRQVDDNITALAGVSVGFDQYLGFDRLQDARIGIAGISNSVTSKTMPDTDGSGFEVNGLADFKFSDRTLTRFGAAYYSGDALNAKRGDALYGFDEYAQIGASNQWNIKDGFNIETGGVIQQNDGKSNWTANINFTWDETFILERLKKK